MQPLLCLQTFSALSGHWRRVTLWCTVPPRQLVVSGVGQSNPLGTAHADRIAVLLASLSIFTSLEDAPARSQALFPSGQPGDTVSWITCSLPPLEPGELLVGHGTLSPMDNFEVLQGPVVLLLLLGLVYGAYQGLYLLHSTMHRLI